MNLDSAKWLNSSRTQLPSLLQLLSQHLQQTTLRQLSKQFGYRHLRLSFEAYIALIGPEGSKQSDIARTLGVSKQNCNQIVKDIETAGYLKRWPDPDDGRSKLLQLTALGQSLKRDGSDTIVTLEQQLLEICGRPAFDQAHSDLSQLCTYFDIPFATTDTRTPFSSVLFRLNHYVNQALFNDITRHQHPDLKPSHGQIFSLIDSQSISLQQLAKSNNVSKQAIGVMASQLEKLGYVHRQTQPDEPRQIFYGLTNKGRALIVTSAVCVDNLYGIFEQVLGAEALHNFEAILQTLSDGLQLKAPHKPAAKPEANSQLAAKLIDQLGPSSARALAETLLKQLDE